MLRSTQYVGRYTVQTGEDLHRLRSRRTRGAARGRY